MIETKELNETQQKLFETLVFLTKLLVAGIVFRAILWIYPDTKLLQSFLGDLISAMLNSSGIESVKQGIYIYIGDTPYVITQDCLGWKSLAAFTGLVYASTSRTLEHLNFILQGFAVILLANIIRVYSTVFLAEKGIISFQVIHDVLWSWSLTLLVLIIWAYWFTRMKDREPFFQRKIKERVKRIRQR
ncbi:MAG: exosortase/archaeosortase family protein [Candidatus Nanohaloarchaea archaeon]